MKPSMRTHHAPDVLEKELASVLWRQDGCLCLIVNGAAFVAPVVIERVVTTKPEDERAGPRM